MGNLTTRTELATTPAAGDLVHIVDVSDTTDNASGTSKKITTTNLLAGKADASHTHATSDVTSGTFADARIAQSNVTQHEAAINHDALSGFVAAEHYDWTQDQGANNIHVNNITEAAVTQHQAALSITESQISDLSHVDSTKVPLAGGTMTGQLNFSGTTHAGIKLLSLTTTQRDALTPAAGMVIYNTTTSNLEGYDGTSWVDLGQAAGGGISAVVDDTTPQLGGMLDVNGQPIGDGTLELLKFSETASAVNEVTITNAATGNAPSLSATGDDTNIDLNLVAKGTGNVQAGGVDVATISDTQTLTNKTINTASNTLVVDAGDVTTGTFADARVAQSNVTQHQAALSITESQISDLSHVDSTKLPLAGGTLSGLLQFSGTTHAGIRLISLTTTERDALTPAAGDLIFNETTSTVQAYDGTSWEDVPGAGGGGLANVVEDTTPQLGGQLDVNGNAIGDGTLELLKFVETASAVNEVTITNAATTGAPEISSTGDDTNIGLKLTPKGTGALVLDGLNWPTADGTADQVLKTDGSGNLSFTTVSGGGGTAKDRAMLRLSGEFGAVSGNGYRENTSGGSVTATQDFYNLSTSTGTTDYASICHDDNYVGGSSDDGDVLFDLNPTLLINTSIDIDTNSTHEVELVLGGRANAVDMTGWKSIGFHAENDASNFILNAVNDNSTTQTKTAITVPTTGFGTNVTVFGRLAAVMDSGTDIKFYTAGVLRATHTTNLPSGAPEVYHNSAKIINGGTSTTAKSLYMRTLEIYYDMY